jgi:hypothetical protein
LALLSPQRGFLRDAPLRFSRWRHCVTNEGHGTIATADSMLKNVPATVARLTGGEYFKRGSERNLQQDLLAMENHLPNRFILSFHPQAPHPGLHVLTLKLPDNEGLKVTARTSYWAELAAPTSAVR